MEIGRPNQEYMINDQGVKWVKQMKILGINFTNNNKNITTRNFEPKIAQIQKEMAQWRRRNITPMGRITVIKSLFVSKFVHLLTALPNPSRKELKQLEKIFFEFLWEGKRDPVKRAKVIQNYSHGGLRMLDLQSFVKSMKISWINRLFTGDMTWQEIIRTDCPDIKNILTYGSRKILHISSGIKNMFWKNVLEAFASFSCALKPDLNGLLSENIWYSDYTKFNRSIVHYWNAKGIRFLSDLISESTGKLHTKESLQETFGIKMTFLCFSSLKKKFTRRNKISRNYQRARTSYATQNEYSDESFELDAVSIWRIRRKQAARDRSIRRKSKRKMDKRHRIL